MTGQCNVRNYTKFGKLEGNQVRFGNLFKDAGYKTEIVVKWQLGKEKIHSNILVLRSLVFGSIHFREPMKINSIHVFLIMSLNLTV